MTKSIERPSRLTRNDDQRERKSDFEFIILCMVLTAVIFGLIHAVIYFTDPTGTAARTAAKSATTPASHKAPIVLP